MKAALAIAAVLVSTAAFAQTSPGPPGPYVIDVRGVMSGTPSASAFLPPVPAATLVPRRGFGIGIGGSVYAFHLGAARLGLGVDVANIRGTATTPAPPTTSSSTSSSSTTTTAAGGFLSTQAAISMATRITIISPQLSFNFGTRDGWSYLSAGYGSAHIRSEASGQEAVGPLTGAVTLVQDSKRADAINYGGGARWFIKDHLGVGFDFRFQRVAKTFRTPGTKMTVLSVGVALR